MTPEEVRQRAEAHDISLSMTIDPFMVRIVEMLEKLQVKTSHRQILGTTFILNSMATSHPIVAEDLISLVLMEEREEALRLFMKDHFLGFSVIEVQYSTVIFHLPSKGYCLVSEAFEKMESCPESAHLKDFIVKHSTLDMVLTSFAKTGTTDAGSDDEYGLFS